MINILMIEDDIELADILSEYLAQYDIKVTNIDDPFLGVSTLNQEKFDLVILDLTLPGLDGLEVCSDIRKRHDIPIIISSARHDIVDKVEALERGADDYLPKPYNPRELEARIKSLLRRKNHNFNSYKGLKKKENLTFIVDEEKMQIKQNGKVLNLTSAEYGILKYLINKNSSVVSREELLYNIKVINEESTYKSIDVIIGRIRHKINDNPREPKYIHSIRGVGYKFTQWINPPSFIV